MAETMTYAGVGVDYDVMMDPFKRFAQQEARETAHNLLLHGFHEVSMSRGESTYLIEGPDFILAHTEEGLGTKCIPAEAWYRETSTGFEAIAQDTVAMIVNDMITLGAMPLTVQMHLAVGESHWFSDQGRYQMLVRGWRRACDQAFCSWGGGETPTLRGVVVPGTIVLSGSAVGIIKPKDRLITGAIESGDAIVLVKSSGIHANGITMAREIAERKDLPGRVLLNMLFERRFPLQALPSGYLTHMNDGRRFGEALLNPTIIYVRLVRACLDAKVPIHYAVNITGHGWRKLMRHPESFAYVVEDVPEPQEVFRFIQERGPVDDREAYANFNMGAGFALYVPQAEVARVIDIADTTGYSAMYAGYIEKRGSEKKVEIVPKGIVFTEDTLKLR